MNSIILFTFGVILLASEVASAIFVDHRLHRISTRTNLVNKTARSTTSLSMSSSETHGTELRYGGLHHCGILVRNAEESKKFYMEVFGFADDSHLRPKSLPYPGAFLRAGSSQLHLMELPIIDPLEGRPEHGGRDRHTAITVNSIDTLAQRLQARNISYTLSMSGRRALFCRDLDMNAFEFMEEAHLSS